MTKNTKISDNKSKISSVFLLQKVFAYEISKDNMCPTGGTFLVIEHEGKIFPIKGHKILRCYDEVNGDFDRFVLVTGDEILSEEQERKKYVLLTETERNKGMTRKENEKFLRDVLEHGLCSVFKEKKPAS